MKKRCEICGKIYESQFGSIGYLSMSHPIITDTGNGRGVEHTENINYQTCTDCVKKVREFIDNLIDGDADKDKEAYAPKKTGRWSFLYSPIVNTTIAKCSCCEFTLEENGRIHGDYLKECPNCKAEMEARSND